MGALTDTLTKQLRSIRNEKTLSIEHLAEKLGMSPESYVKIENGDTPITLERVETIAQALEVSLPELLNLASTIIAHNTTNAEKGAGYGYIFGNPSNYHDNRTINMSVSSEVLESLLQRIDTLEAKLARQAKKQQTLGFSVYPKNTDHLL